MLFCKDHSKKTLSSKFLHVPRNPHFDSVIAEQPEIFAPAIIKPNFVKSGGHGEYSTSAPKVDVVGGYFGMCSCTIQPSSNEPVMMREQTMQSHILSLQREEIMQAAMSAHGKESMEKLLKNELFRSIYDSNVTNHGGTYVDITDVLINWDLLQKELKGISTNSENLDINQNEANGDYESTITMSNLIISPVHDSMASPMKMISIEKGDKCPKLISNLIDIIVNCRPIHAKMLHDYLSTNDEATKQMLHSCRLNSWKSSENIKKCYSILSKNMVKKHRRFQSKISFLIAPNVHSFKI